jgi:hypothetical protein
MEYWSSRCPVGEIKLHLRSQLQRFDEGLVSHVAVIGEYPGPFPFREGGKLIEN